MSKSALVTRCTFLPSQHHPHEYVEHSLRTPPLLGGARCGALEGQKNGAVFILSRDSVSMYIVLGLCVYYTRIAVTYYIQDKCTYVNGILLPMLAST